VRADGAVRRRGGGVGASGWAAGRADGGEEAGGASVRDTVPPWPRTRSATMATPETDAAVVASARVVEAGEAFEDAVAVVGRDARAVVR